MWKRGHNAGSVLWPGRQDATEYGRQDARRYRLVAASGSVGFCPSLFLAGMVRI
jgi:hypothetical protein